jgi:WD40 repeat protein
MAASERDATRAGTSEAPDQAHALPRAESGQILARGAEAAGWSRDDGRGYGPTGPLPRGVSPVCVLPGHTAAITLLRWGPDGQILASAGAEETVRLWRVQRRIGAPLNALVGHSAVVTALCWSSLGQFLASAAADGTVCVWGLPAAFSPNPSPLAAWWGHDGSVQDADWSPSGQYLATAGSDRAVRLWDLMGNPVGAWQAHGRGGVTALAWSPDERVLASGGADQQILLWDAASARQTLAFDRHSDEIRQLAWSPDGTLLAVAGKRDPHIAILHRAMGSRLASLNGHSREVVGLCWSSDGAWLISAAADRTLRIWSTHRFFAHPTSQPLQLLTAPLVMAGSMPAGMIALGADDMQILIMQLTV